MVTTTFTPDYIRHIYALTHATKTYKVYTLQQVNRGEPQLTQEVRIEDYNGKSNATQIKDYFRMRTTGNWATCEKVTGLRPTTHERVYYGDRLVNGRKSLIVFNLNEDRTKLCIDYYRSFYPKTPYILKDIISKKKKK